MNGFTLASNYIKQNARGLEKSLYNFHFENGNVDSVITELSEFQNEDGGFGHALEPDVRLNDSSVLATTIAFQKFRELDLPSSEIIVKKASQYLLSTYDENNKVWLNVPININDSAHAPWWNYSNEYKKFLANPRAEILGYFYDYPDLFPENLRNELTEELLAYLKSLGNSIEMHDLLCFVRLVETNNFPEITKNKMIDILKPLVISSVTTNPSDRDNYGLTPLTIISSPISVFYPELKHLVLPNFEYIFQKQSNEGYWSPTWNWESVSKEDWLNAERDLRGIITLNNLLLFKNFDFNYGSKD